MPKPSKNAARRPDRAGKRSAAKSPPPSVPQSLVLAPVVGMGASAGGLEALQRFFAQMPADTGMAFILVQHLDPRRETLMPELLGKTTQMSVEQVKDETPVEPNRVYVIPPNATLTIEGGLLRVKSPPDELRLRMPIDSLFHSLAEDQRGRAVCILLSGSGTDGTLGLRSVKEHGGMAMAQAPGSAKHDSILRSAIATGLVDHVLLPEEMPAKLVEYAAYLRDLQQRNEAGALFEAAGDQLARICALLKRKTGHDFSRYKTTTLVRRIQRRMQVLQVSSVEQYVERLRKDIKEADQLFRDLLISVTHFFRDPDAFQTLARQAIPRIFEHAGAEGGLRVWTPGCATGEEAYSVAILLREEMARRDHWPKVQVFAGDIDDEALEFARTAHYPEGIAEHVTPARLDKFFIKHDHSYHVVKEVREMCIFATHNLIRDPPFSRLDLIVCRNLLIYLEADLQRHVANVFHYGLRTGGYLFLGPSESVAGPPDLFRTVDKRHRLFQRTETMALPAPLLLPEQPPARRGSQPVLSARPPGPDQRELLSKLERLLLEQYAPAWVIINAQQEAVYFSPRTGRYLEPAAGAPSSNVVGMARKGLRLDLRTALHKAVKTGEVVTHEDVAVETNGDIQPINLVVRPLPELGSENGYCLVIFQELGPAKSREQARRDGNSPVEGDQMVQQLESELRSTREHLQATIEEVETSNEELKSSNEELLSTNEELQSANEELQTSKEELQSVNEELETINTELNKKLEELDAANSDLNNLLHSTQIPTIFLDNSLRIKRFTAAATSVFRLIETDIARPILDIAPRFDEDMLMDIKEVQRTLSVKEKQVRLADGSAVYLMRILPYRRVDSVIDGLVLTFLELTQLNRALEQQARLAAIVESSQDAIVGRSFDGTITAWNPAAVEMFGYTQQEALGKPIQQIVPGEGLDDMESVQARVREGESVRPYESVRRTREGNLINVSIAMSPIRDGRGRVTGASAIFRDITELKLAQEQLRREAHEKDQFLALLSHELRNPLAPLRISLEVLRSQAPRHELVERSLSIMDRQLSQLTSLVDQLLDAARITSGKILLNPDELDLRDLVREMVEDYRRNLEEGGLEADLSLPERPVYVRADRIRLSQTLGNLLSNAAKFSNPGGKVSVKVVAERERGVAVTTVTDTGIGMDPKTLARVFLPFAQGREGERTHGGLGLGLWLVKALVDAHGGTVRVHSAGLGEGTQVTIRLPLLAVEPKRGDGSGAKQQPAVVPRRILVVEDNGDALESLRRLLELQGHAVEAVATGGAAIEAARSFRPDVVLCDIMLGGDMDGFGVAEALRSKGDGGPYLVALTGYGQPEDRERTQASGFDWHITKPPTPEQLIRLLAELPRR
jgi:two-component system CheB/CheR fusion protein